MRGEKALGIAWSSGAFAQAIAFNLYASLLFRYLTDSVGIAAAPVGAIIGGSKFYNAFLAPTIGTLTDRVGRRRLWILIGGLLLGLSVVLMFGVPMGLSMTGRQVWAAMAVLVFSTGYTTFAIPWLAIPPEISRDVHWRTKMMAWRVGFSSIGQTLATAIGPMMLAAFGAGAAAYGALGWTMGALCALGTIATVIATRHAPPAPPSTRERPVIREGLRLLGENRPFLVMVMLKATLYFGLGFQGASLALITRWVMGLSDYWLGSYMLASTVSLLTSQPLWVW